jgi:hypothetical protein
MRTMYDGITPSAVPAGAQLYAGYLSGKWPSYSALAAGHPTAVHVSISISASYNGGIVLDIENGDATPTESVDWVIKRRAAGVDPTAYCNTSTWGDVRKAFQTRKVAEPHYWLAQYDSVATIPAAWTAAGVVAKQHTNKSGYDISVVADYWPGVDPEPTPTPPAATQSQQEDDMQYNISITPDPTNSANRGAGQFTVDPRGNVIHLPTAADVASAVALFGQPHVFSQAFYKSLVLASPTKVVVA